MQNVFILLIAVLFLLYVVAAAAIYVIQYQLNAKMTVLQTDATKLAIFDARLNEHINKPDSSMEQYRQIVERIESAEIAIRGIKRESDSKEESLRRLIAKNAARQRFSKPEEEENNGHAAPANAAQVSDASAFDALAAQGKVIPWPNSQVPAAPAAPHSFGKIANA